MGGAWLVQTLWERYLFTQDRQYLKSVAYPLMKGAADFCLGWVVANPHNPRELITAPSTAPENDYITDEGYNGVTCYGGAADLAILADGLLQLRDRRLDVFRSHGNRSFQPSTFNLRLSTSDSPRQLSECC